MPSSFIHFFRIFIDTENAVHNITIVKQTNYQPLDIIWCIRYPTGYRKLRCSKYAVYSKQDLYLIKYIREFNLFCFFSGQATDQRTRERVKLCPSHNDSAFTTARCGSHYNKLMKPLAWHGRLLRDRYWVNSVLITARGIIRCKIIFLWLPQHF